MMNKKLQAQRIKYALKKKYGIDEDLVDLEAEIDSTLTLTENYNMILKKYGYIGTIQNNDIGTNKLSNAERFLKARELNEKRSINALRLDWRKKAKNIYEIDTLTKQNYKKWKKHKNRYDIKGIDY